MIHDDPQIVKENIEAMGKSNEEESESAQMISFPAFSTCAWEAFLQCLSTASTKVLDVLMHEVCVMLYIKSSLIARGKDYSNLPPGKKEKKKKMHQLISLTLSYKVLSIN